MKTKFKLYNNGNIRMVFIPGNVPSLKNSKVKTANGIFSSKTVGKYIRGLGIQSYSPTRREWKGYADKTRPNLIAQLIPAFEEMKSGKDYPLIMGIHHVRNSKRLFDFSNSVEIIQDLLQAHGIIEDDNVSFLFSVPMTLDGKMIDEHNPRSESLYSVDKENPGVWVRFY